MILNSKQSILDAMALKTETVTIDGGEVIVSEVTAKVYLDTFNDASVKDDEGKLDGSKFSALLAVRSVVDEDRNRIFTDADADLFASGSTKVYTAIVEAVKRLNGIGGDEKNSETTQTN